MDHLTLELVVMVFNHLIEDDLVPKAYSEYTDELADKQTRWGRTEPCVKWVMLTQASYSAILNTRISCWKMYHGSHEAFAKVLGDIKFRFTKVGTEDMTRIGQKAALTPYITTLTFGCGGFHRP